MKFKHTFHVFVDNFKITYKQFLYRLVIDLIALAIMALAIVPFVSDLLPELNKIVDSAYNYIVRLLSGDVGNLAELAEKVKTAFNSFIELLQTKKTQIVLICLLMLFVYIVEGWFKGLGNYATAAIVNDKMTLRADTPFIVTILKNLKQASIYNLIYVPLSVLYDLAVIAVSVLLLMIVFSAVVPFFICIYLCIVLFVFATSVKMTFTTDWLPALICGKMKQGEAMKYAFSRKNKHTLNVLSNFIVLVLIIFGVNVAAIICTFGAGAIITVPASYIILICFEMVNYCDATGKKYFLDDNKIVNGSKDRALTREEFFRGET